VGIFELLGSCLDFQVQKMAGEEFDVEAGQTSFDLEVQVSDGKTYKLISTHCRLVNGVPGGCDDGSFCDENTIP
jgi:hypothetical protein